MEEKIIKIKLGREELILSTGKVAKQANGSVFATYGGTCVLATVCCGSDIKEDLDFVPLSVDYNEKYYAAGKIPGGFFKREGKPREKEILVSRLIDRPMRPLFSKQFKREIQIVPTTMSVDQINPPDVVAMVAASTAVTISDIPFDGPVGAVRVGLIDGNYIINPTFDEVERASLDIVVAGTIDGITMVEGGAKEVSEDQLVEAIEFARGSILDICKAQLELREAVGKEKLPLIESEEFSLENEIRDYAFSLLKEACFVKGKLNRNKAIKEVKDKVKEYFLERLEESDIKRFYSLLDDIEQEIVRSSILDNKLRTDGRGPEDIRPITCEIDVLPRTHGSALFTRGETQALAITTLGTVFDEQIMDDLEGDKRENFLLHYNFPPFSVGEVGRMMTGRREIGHGHLAHRALEAVIPSKEEFPYTLRVVSEILESNGSSSMATVCGGTLSLLNAGVPLKKPVAGIAMGMVTDGERTVVLSDILGEEDHLGDMDFKVAGTEDGITAFQMDIKVKNISPDTMRKALEQAKKGRLHILEIMNKAIDSPREEISEYAPRIIRFAVDPDKIGMLIGPGGKNIKHITEKYDVTINIDDDGSVVIYSKQKENAENAREHIDKLLEEPEVGKIYDGTVKRIVDFGAFIEFLPGKEGLCHISQMADYHVKSPHDIVKLDQSVQVKIIEIDKMGRVNLTMLVDKEQQPRGKTPSPRNNRPYNNRRK
ncbi:polyribonucleotide nucleotidyltransferase [Spirochaetia bacterium 38H-sp]|uniref:Polyribonucleotide nucleotidyltransferase n=1 Tax=Rarispira pelagica TaxID=3141764 RepID=A0ABU9UAY9_9SPIR